MFQREQRGARTIADATPPRSIPWPYCMVSYGNAHVAAEFVFERDNCVGIYLVKGRCLLFFLLFLSIVSLTVLSVSAPCIFFVL